MGNSFSTKTPLGKAKGLGSAKEGAHHWWMQRVTAIALTPLTLWLVTSLIALVGAEREAVIHWFGHPLAALALVAVVVVGLYHAMLGLQVVIEDYIHHDVLRQSSLMIVRFVGYALAGCCLVATLIMVFMRFMSVN